MPKSNVVTGRNQKITIVEASLVQGVVKPRHHERPFDICLLMLSKKQTKQNGGSPKVLWYPSRVPESFINGVLLKSQGESFMIGDRVFLIKNVEQLTTDEKSENLVKLGHEPIAAPTVQETTVTA